MKKYILLLILLFCASSGMKAQTFSDDNFIYTASPKKAVQSGNYSTLTKDEITQSVTFFDGLGRPVQTVAINQGAGGQDIVTPVEYDAFGRQTKEHLPYPSANAGTNYARVPLAPSLSAQQAFYAARYDNTTNPFSEKKLESSPLNRVLKQAASGNSWAMDGGHEIKLDYQTNTGSEVKLYKAAASWNADFGLYEIGFSDAGNYAANELYKNITYDENSAANPTDETLGSTVEFKNKQGQVVLKRTYDAGVRHDTYYVYDIYGNLTYVIPPKADSTIDQSVLDNLCYQYKYDNRNRLVEKKLPGKQWEFIVYDKLDRPVATGPVNSPFSDISTPGWIITKYDIFNRAVYTGWMTETPATATGRKTLQDAQNFATVLSESKSATGTINGIQAYYSNNVAPTIFKLLTVNYYDNYTFPSSPTIEIPTIVAGQNTLNSLQVKGLVTASWTRILTTSASLAGETTATFYDANARPVRSYTQNHLGDYTYTDTNLDFTGVPQYTITHHKRAVDVTELKTKEVFTYSPQGRLTLHTHQINDGTVEVIASNTYDELGHLISKKVGNTTTAPTQKVDYSYNIRGWLTAINDIDALSKADAPKDLFAFKINYDGITDQTKKLYNGNISQTFWVTDNEDKTVKNYVYTYDKLNRLKSATDNTTFFNEDNIQYDKNGNITRLKRNGHLTANPSIATPANYGLMDDLTYAYDAGNRLQTVSDLGNDTYGFKDDVTGVGVVDAGTDYTYDANGNMLTDANKAITNIAYNHLNLPTKITFAVKGNIEYIYNAEGQKVQKIVSETARPIVTTDYLGGYQYTDNTLQFFPTAEGYVQKEASSYKYVYQYKDHLGNVRLSYDNNRTIQEENNYYPFGLKQEGYNKVVVASNYKYKYNGKEFQDELGLNFYDYGARNYDPALGRWMNIDPLAEKAKRFSPYVYALNNPIFFVDPDGMLSDAFINDLWQKSGNETKWSNNNDGTFSSDNNKTVEYQEDEKSKAAELKNNYSNMVNKARKDGHNMAADNLQRWLNGTGGTKIISNKWLRSNREVVSGEDRNIERFQEQLQQLGETLKDGQSTKLDDYWDTLVTGGVFGELYYASGTGTLTSRANFKLTRKGNSIVISGSITHNWSDTYDWHPGANAYIPGFGFIEDSDAKLVEKYCGAKPFEMQGAWKQSFNKSYELGFFGGLNVNLK